MAKAPRKHQARPDIELVPDAWPRFEQFIREVVKAGPQHREAAGEKRTAKRRTRPGSK